MPSLKDSLVTLDSGRYQPASGAALPAMQNPPILPAHLVASTVLISSLPSIATDVDGITRQFYRYGGLPTRRLMQP
jgi:hypothetical protein